ncbi:MAG: hypothetical protein ABS81_21030 [Pseudonocardia sp. SCN 72-86]|nr:MAG: hypothetical protein ABS81_21030 [Pseudonocardia sp. SCN 72-86]
MAESVAGDPGTPYLDIRLPAGVEARFEATTEVPARAGWRPARTVIDRDLDALVDDLKKSRGCTSRAVAGSLFVLDYARRLSWPVLSAHLRLGARLDPSWSNVRLAVNPTGLPHVGFAVGPEIGPAKDVAEVVDALVTGHFAYLVERLHTLTGVGRRTLWGNVAVAVMQVFMAFSWASGDREHFLAAAQRTLANRPEMRGTVSLESVRHGDQNWMVIWRRTCCLAFRVETQGELSYCGTCCIVEHDDRVASFHGAADRYIEIERAGVVARPRVHGDTGKAR